MALGYFTGKMTCKIHYIIEIYLHAFTLRSQVFQLWALVITIHVGIWSELCVASLSLEVSLSLELLMVKFLALWQSSSDSKLI